MNAKKGIFEPIEKIEAKDASTAVVTLKRLTGHFLFDMGRGDAVIVAPESAETNKANLVGTGPFMFDSWAKGNQIRIKKSGSHWGTPKLSQVTTRSSPIPPPPLPPQAGDVDMFANSPPPS